MTGKIDNNKIESILKIWRKYSINPGIKEAEEYLKDKKYCGLKWSASLQTFWHDIQDLENIRNCITHCDGKIRWNRDKTKIKKLKEKHERDKVKLEDDIKKIKDKVKFKKLKEKLEENKGLEINDDDINIINKEYLLGQITLVENFLTELYAKAEEKLESKSI